MILFFDRSMGTRIPRALRFLKPPVEIRFHDEEFKKNEHTPKHFIFHVHRTSQLTSIELS